jgi:hypothetical protein
MTANNQYENVKMEVDLTNVEEMYNKMKNFQFNRINIKRQESNKIILNLTNIDSDDSSDDEEKPMKQIIRHLGKFRKIKGDEIELNNEMCSICCSEYKKNEFYRKMDKCGHIFHKKCVDKWFFVNQNCECPLCRSNHNSVILK